MLFGHAAPALLDGPAAQLSALFYLLVGTVGIQAVFKASWPLDRLRAFLCATMTAGFYAAVLVLRARLQVALPSVETLWLLLGFAAVSFLVERVATLALRLADRARLREEGRHRQDAR